VNAAGPYVKVELMAEDGQRVDVELPRATYQALRIEHGERLYVTPRTVRVFTEDYSI